MDLDERKKRILASVVENYIESAEPVGSTKIAEEYEREFSSATIRSEMKLLEDDGFLEQPHISAGRVPSTKGYRYYVDNLMLDNTLSMLDIDYINNNIVSYGNVESTLENAANVISKLLKLPTVLNIKSSDTVENIKVLKISEKILLIVLMSKNGTVKDVIIKINDTLPETRVDELSKLLNKNLKGTPLESLPNVLTSVVHKELKKFASVLEEMNKHIALVEEKENTSIKGDIGEFLTIPEFNDVDKVKKLLSILNTREIISEALEKMEENNVSIIIGNEHSEMLLKDYSIISLDIENELTNANIGIVSPKRVDYKKATAVFKLVNDKLKKLFGENREVKDDS